MTADSDLVTIKVASERSGVPARTIRSWCKATSERPALIIKQGHSIRLSEVERVRDEIGWQPRGAAKKGKSDRLPVEEFARRVGRAKATVYIWKSQGVISAYTSAECERMIRVLAEKERGGPSLDEAARINLARTDETPGSSVSAPGPDTVGREATQGEIRAEQLRKLRRDNMLANGQLYEAKAAEETVRRIATTYKESTDRLAIEIPRVVAAELDKYAVQMDATVRASIASAVQSAVLSDAPRVEKALAALRSA